MMENSPEIGPHSQIDSTLEKIRSNTSDEERGGVILFEQEKTPAEKRANEIYDSLSLTLGEIAEEAAAQSKKGQHGREAEIVLNEILEVTNVTNAFSKGEVEFERNTSHEAEATARGDKIYSYRSNGALIGLKEYDVDLMIRPAAFERIAEVGRNVQFEDDREQRLALRIHPRQAMGSDILVRIDPEDEIQFDIQADWVDLLDFSAAGQKAGHHFSSGLKYADSRASFREVLETINTKVKVRGAESLRTAA
ncbi:MAG: hypothetical protein Q8P13_00630 [bacterium]|nr:hypothetical protein [bacterium]